METVCVCVYLLKSWSESIVKYIDRAVIVKVSWEREFFMISFLSGPSCV